MDISLTSQLLSFFYAVAMGLVFGVIYDVFRLFRVFTKGRTAAVFIEDILFWTVCAFICYSFMLIFTHGTVRIYVVLAAMSGFYVYQKTVGKLTALLFRCLYKPVFLLKKSLKRIFAKIISKNTKKLEQNS